MMISAPAYGHPPVVDAMEAMRLVLDGSLTEKPRRGERGECVVTDSNNLAWTFTAGSNFQPMPVRTYATLEKKMKAGAAYFTPNTFYHRKRKDKSSLRWLNTFFVDIDDPELCLLDIFDIITDSGLPGPSVINKTPHGWHIYWKIERVRATPKAIRLYEAILKKIVAAIGGDPMAASAEHFMRILISVQYFTTVRYSLQDFIDWADIISPDWRSEKRSSAVVSGPEIMNHPAVQVLMQGVEEGRRNNTCFTLALAMRSAGYSHDRTMTELTAWNFRNQPPLPISHIRASVRSAYSGKYHAPSARAISELSGVEFHHRVIRSGGGSGGGGGGRKRGPYRSKKETREKFLQWLRDRSDQDGRVVSDLGQKKIAKEINVAHRTLVHVIAEMKDEGILTVSTVLLGRGKHETTYILSGESEKNKAPESSEGVENEPGNANVSGQNETAEKGHPGTSGAKVVSLKEWKTRREVEGCRDP